MRLPRPAALRLLLALLLLLPWACDQGMSSLLRRHTYPPSFRYVPKNEVRSAMWLLGKQSLELSRILRNLPDGAQPPQSQVVLLLADMEITVNDIGGDQWSTNHPELGPGLQALAQDLRAAKAAAERKPPNYFLAGSVSGACLYCHRP